MKKERSSFLKKRTKKLLVAVAALSGSARQEHKSFLVLFFKKELLSFLVLSCLSACAQIPPSAIVSTSIANIDVGANDVGQSCILDSPPGSATGRVYCTQSKLPGARLARVAEPGALEVIIATSRWRAQLDETLTCRSPESTQVLDQPALLMTCTVQKTGLTRLVVLSRLQNGVWSAQCNGVMLPAAERAMAVLGGTLAPKLAAHVGAGLTARRLAADEDAEYDQLIYAAVHANRAGDFIGAADAYRRALAVHRKLLGKPNSPLLIDDMTGLAIQVSAEGRNGEAHRLLTQADHLAESTANADPLDTDSLRIRAQILYARGVIAFNEDKYADAIMALGRAGETYKQLIGPEVLAGAGTGSTGVRRIADRAARAAVADDPVATAALSRLIDTERHEAAAMRKIGRVEDSRRETQEVEQWAATGLSEGVAASAVRANVYETAAFVAADRHQDGDAQVYLARATASFNAVDPDSFAAARSALSLAAQEMASGHPVDAAKICRQTAASLASADAGIDPGYILPCLDALWSTRQAGAGDEAAARSMFEMAQLAQSTITSQQIAATALRLRQQSRVAVLLKRLDDARQERSSAEAALDLAQQDTQDIRDKAEARLAAAQKAADMAEENVDAAQPGYAALVDREVTAEAALAALQPGEAFVSMLFGGSHGWVFLLRDGHVVAAKSTAGRAAIASLVGRVRRSAESEGAVPPPFDTVASYTLYQDVLSPVAATLKGARSLIVAPSGPLLALPFAILLTRPTSPDALAGAPWLIRDVPVAHLPAPSSLVSLRKLAGAPGGTRPYAGFGEFRGIPLVQARASFPLDTCGHSAQDLANLPELPFTKYVLTKVPAIVGAGPEDELTGPAFTADNVTAQAEKLAQARVILFATHALLPTDLACEAEPSLVTNLPPNTTDATGALLTETKVAKLNLNADLVILYGCNTGGGGVERKGESLSGLARGFFAAGARSLLVTHWSGLQSTGFILVDFMQNDEQAQFHRPAEALANAQLAFLADATGTHANFAHPFWWGQLAFVGLDAPAPRS